MVTNSPLPLARITLPSPDEFIGNIKSHINKSLNALNERPLLQKSLQTIGTAVVAAAVGATICAPLKTMNLNLAGGRQIEMGRIITSLAPKQLVPHFKAIATNNLTLLMPQILANEMIEKIPALAQLPQDKKKAIANITATAFCASVYLNQGVTTNNRLAQGLPLGLNALAAERGRMVLMATAAAFLTRETCGLTGLTTHDNPQLVKTVTHIATVADLAFANLSIAGPNKLPNALQAAAYCVSRSFEASLYFQTTKTITNHIGKALNNVTETS